MPPQRTTEFCTTVGEVPPPLAGCPWSAPPGFRSDARRGLVATAQHTASPRPGPCGGPRPARSGHAAWTQTRTLVDAPFQKPAERGLTEVEVTDPGHPLFGRRFAVVSVSGPRPPGRAGGHILVAHSSRVLLKLPLSAEAVAELIALAEDSEGLTCSSGP